MPRANRRKTKKARKSEVEDSHQQFGCLAVDNLYNIYDITDRNSSHLLSNISRRTEHQSGSGQQIRPKQHLPSQDPSKSRTYTGRRSLSRCQCSNSPPPGILAGS